MFALRLQIGLAGAKKHNGWFQTLPDTGSWGTDYAYRAVVAVYGICANRPAEATYAVGSLDNTQSTLNGSNSYTIHFPAGDLPPVKYFWSLTVYNIQTELIANQYNKYSVGSNKGIKLQQGRLARHLCPAHATRRARGQLAPRPAEHSVHPDHAACTAPSRTC